MFFSVIGDFFCQSRIKCDIAKCARGDGGQDRRTRDSGR